MKAFARTLQFLALALALWAAVPGLAGAQTVSDADREALAGPWNGVWTSDTHVYDASLRMEVTADGQIEGAFTWKLRKSNRPAYQSKIGKTGTEYVRGRFDAQSSLISVDGDRLDDPNKILGTDKYRLVVSENRKTLGGITWDHGSWGGRIFLRR
jgi:hypothetical protein